MGSPVYQIIVPTKFLPLVLQLSHDQSGHMGVRRTYSRSALLLLASVKERYSEVSCVSYDVAKVLPHVLHNWQA